MRVIKKIKKERKCSIYHKDKEVVAVFAEFTALAPTKCCPADNLSPGVVSYSVLARDFSVLPHFLAPLANTLTKEENWPSLISHMVFVDVKHNERRIARRESK